MTAQSLDDVPFDIASYRIILYEQSISGSKKLFAALDQAVKELLSSLDKTNNPVQEAFSKRSVTGIRHRKPLIQVINVAKLHKSLKTLIENENIKYVEDLKKLNLEKMKEKYDLGATNLTTLVKIVLKNEAYDDLDVLQELILKYRLDMSQGYRSPSWEM